MSGLDMMEEMEGSASSSNNGSCSPYDSSNYAAVAAVSAVLAFLSLLLILAVVLIIVLFKKWRSFTQRLVAYLVATAILVDVGIILHRVDYRNQDSAFYRGFCEFGGYIDMTSNWMLLIAIVAIIAHASFVIFFDKNTERYELVYALSIFIFPFLFTWIPFIQDSYGRAGAWCWIRSEEGRTCEPYPFGAKLQLGLWFIPLYLLMVLLITLYVAILAKLYARRRCWWWWKSGQRPRGDAAAVSATVVATASLETEGVATATRKDLLPLIAYPLIYFLLNVFPFLNRIYNIVNPDAPSLTLWWLVAIANPSIGAWIALAFTLDPDTWRRLTRAEVVAAVRELCGRGQVAVEEYEIEFKNTSIRSDSYHQQRIKGDQPYKSYQDCYKLNNMEASNNGSKTD